MWILQTLFIFIQICCSKSQSNLDGLIELSKLQLEVIDNTTFLNIHYMERISLKANRLNSLDSFLHYLNMTDTSNLTEIFLSYNVIQSINEKFPNFKKLQMLDLGYNRIESLGSMVFENLKSLSHLILFGNRLKYIQSDCFVGLDSLAELDLGDNQIEAIDENAFSSLINLKSLYLLRNKLLSLEELQFRNLQQLETLMIGSNKLSKILTYSKVFSNLTSLTALNLPSNNLGTKDLELFKQKNIFNTLWLLDLSNNHIDSIGSYSFSKLINLVYLVLSQSRIEFIEDYSFG